MKVKFFNKSMGVATIFGISIDPLCTSEVVDVTPEEFATEFEKARKYITAVHVDESLESSDDQPKRTMKKSTKGSTENE